MQRNQRITGFRDMGVHAGPAILFRQRNHRGAHRIQFDISAYHQCVAIRLDQAGLEPTLPQGGRPTMTVVEELDVILANNTHQSPVLGAVLASTAHGRDCPSERRRERQCRFETGFTQQLPVVMAILVINEDRRPIHATLDDMKQNM